MSRRFSRLPAAIAWVCALLVVVSGFSVAWYETQGRYPDGSWTRARTYVEVDGTSPNIIGRLFAVTWWSECPYSVLAPE